MWFACTAPCSYSDAAPSHCVSGHIAYTDEQADCQHDALSHERGAAHSDCVTSQTIPQFHRLARCQYA